MITRTRHFAALLTSLLLAGTCTPFALARAPQPATAQPASTTPPTNKPAQAQPDSAKPDSTKPDSTKPDAKQPALSYLTPAAFEHCVDQFLEPYKSGGVISPVPRDVDNFERIVDKQLQATLSAPIMAASKADGEAKERATLWSFASALGPKFTPGNCKAIDKFLNAGFDDAKRVNSATKKQFNRPRPFEEDPDHPKSNPSFPSGHSTTAGVRYKLLTAVTGADDKLELELFKQAWFMCYARLAVNAHYPTDVTAGFSLGEMVGDEILKAAAADPSSDAAKALQAAKDEWTKLK